MLRSLVGSEMCIRDRVSVLILEQVKGREDLAVVGYECLTDQLATNDQLLDDLQDSAYNLGVASAKGGLDWDDELGDGGEDSATPTLKEVITSLGGDELVRLL
eukprot:TRINITY_DN28343_c0_g1_i1.p1 TRINITY_DN28343_c0_g1~~TRINITY_DN28343_c0_g1_i1.p1  ORF type:complete len:103 (+),score=31.55 TRINITY_DN28343_c0_g1_i1:123-431(+)